MKRLGPRIRLLIALTRLFPPWWQQRYRVEFTEMIRALLATGRRDTLSLALDIVVGVLDAHLSASPAAFPVVRRAAYHGLAVAAVLAAANVLTNVLFPASFDDNSPWSGVIAVAGFVGVFVFLTATGARGTQRSTTRHAGIKAGAMAGFVLVTVTMLSWFVIDNLFFGTISQQPEKVITFATSGQSSMRTFINLDLVRATALMIPELTVVGAVFGCLGSRLARLARTSSPDERKVKAY